MPLTGVTLLLGKEEFFKKQFLRSLRGSGAQEASGAFNRQEITAPGQPLAPLLDFVTTAPFLAETRVAIIRDVEKLPAAEQEALLRTLGRLIASATVALLSDELSPKKSSFLHKLSEVCTVRYAKPLFDNELPGWVQLRAKKAERSMAPSAVESLLQRVGRDLSGLDSAIEQLSVYTHGRSTMIAAVDVEALLGRTSQRDVFKLVDTLIEGRLQESLKQLKELFAEGVKAQEIVGALAYQLERFKSAADLLAAGTDKRQVCEKLRVRPTYQGAFIRQVEEFGRSGRLLRRLQSLFEYDRAVKAGGLREEVALEGWVLRGG